MEHRIYLDNNATTPVDPRVVELMNRFHLEEFGNASSIHKFGLEARKGLEDARAKVAGLIGARPGEIIFTSGGTEADNMAVFGIAESCGHQGRHIVTSAIEHPAVLRACEILGSRGYEVDILPVERDGSLDPGRVKEALTDETILVSVMAANNESGTLQPISEIGQMSRSRGIAFHTDAVQAIGKSHVDVKEMNVDLLSLTGHKFHGPMGAGALYARSGTRLSALMVGGSHERGLRAGTENIPGTVGLGEACRIAREEIREYAPRLERLRDRLEDGILGGITDTVVNGSRSHRTPQTSNISFLGVEGESLLMALDEEGIAVSTGAACHSGTTSGSHVLAAMGLKGGRLQGAIRFSLGRTTTEKDIDSVLNLLPETVKKLRKTATLGRR